VFKINVLKVAHESGGKIDVAIASESAQSLGQHLRLRESRQQQQQQQQRRLQKCRTYFRFRHLENFRRRIKNSSQPILNFHKLSKKFHWGKKTLAGFLLVWKFPPPFPPCSGLWFSFSFQGIAEKMKVREEEVKVREKGIIDSPPLSQCGENHWLL